MTLYITFFNLLFHSYSPSNTYIYNYIYICAGSKATVFTAPAPAPMAAPELPKPYASKKDWNKLGMKHK